MTGCVATTPDDSGHGGINSFDEFQEHAAAHLNAAQQIGSDTDATVAVALAKAEALVRLARAVSGLSGRRGDVIGPASLGPDNCYNHRGWPVGPCLDI
ncbi:MAG: hypothetical protein VCB77_04150 [Alphaproteobacteria bacterium]